MALGLLVFLMLAGKGLCLEVNGSSGRDKDYPTPRNEADMVAFSARLSSDIVITEGYAIVFDNVLTNVGDLYFPTSGQFACPDGLYVFMWTILKTGNPAVGMQCSVQLRKGGVDQKYGPKTSYYDTYYSGSTSMMTVLPCTSSPPTAVTIVAESWSDTNSQSYYHGGYTGFSGFKLQSSIAFTAELSTDSYIIGGGRIFFDRVLHNFGDSYDVTNGRFRCPDDGIYVFSVSTSTTDPSTPWSVARLMKEREVVVEGPITFRATADYDSGSAATTTVLQCSTGHSIYVEAQAAHDFPYNSYAAVLTSFTGFKLYDATAGYAAFSAVTTANHTTTYVAHPFVIDKVITNIGGAFDPSLSVFTCPDDSFYAFTWSATANSGGHNSNIGLYENDGIDGTYSFLTEQETNDASGTTGTGSMAIIKKCKAGSQFQLRGRHIRDYIYLGGYVTFSGYRIPGDLGRM